MKKERVMKKNFKVWILSACITAVFLLPITAVSARPVELKIASVAPKGSPWDDALRKIAADWERISYGDVTMKIYPGGIAGDEADVIRKIRFNQLQGAVLSAYGLNEIAQDTLALSMPFILKSDREFDYVLDKIGPELKQKAARKGFRVVSWTNTGWIYFFTKDPVVYPKDLKSQRVAVSPLEPAMAQAFENLGYSTIPISAAEMLTQLNNNMVDATFNLPLAAAQYQWFGIADNMTDLPISPTLGGIVLSERTWRRIPKAIQPKLIRAAEETAAELYEETQELVAEALKVMRSYGLKVNQVPPQAEELWRETFREGIEMVVGKIFSKQTFEAVIQYRDQFRGTR